MDAIATNRWQVSHHHSAMRPIKDPGRKCRRAITALFDDRRWSPGPNHSGGPRALFLAGAAAMLPAAANSSPAAGSVSSGRVEISVSVGPRYQVLADDRVGVRRGVHSGRPCLATNSSAPVMPVTLVRRPASRPDPRKPNSGENMQLEARTVAGIGRCGPMDDKAVWRAVNPADRTAGQLWLVYPE